MVRGHREDFHGISAVPSSIKLVSVPSEVLVGGKQPSNQNIKYEQYPRVDGSEQGLSRE